DDRERGARDRARRRCSPSTWREHPCHSDCPFPPAPVFQVRWHTTTSGSRFSRFPRCFLFARLNDYVAGGEIEARFHACDAGHPFAVIGAARVCPATRRGSAMLRVTRAVAVVVLVSGLCASAALPASATSGAVDAYGMVVAVNGSTADGACGVAGAAGTFTLLGRNTSQTVIHVSPDTTFFARNISSPTFANVCVNGMAGAQGQVHNG